jgi:hypothetical protein
MQAPVASLPAAASSVAAVEGARRRRLAVQDTGSHIEAKRQREWTMHGVVREAVKVHSRREGEQLRTDLITAVEVTDPARLFYTQLAHQRRMMPKLVRRQTRSAIARGAKREVVRGIVTAARGEMA